MVARWIASACRALAVLLRGVALKCDELHAEYNESVLPPSVEPTPAPIELSLSASSPIRAGYVLPPADFADELDLRDALQKSIRWPLPPEPAGQA